MTDDRIRAKIHQAVDAYSISMQEDPFLAQRLLAAQSRKEAPRMKKLSTGLIIAIVLMLLSVTAVAVGLTIEDVWQQSFEKMGTTGLLRNFGDPNDAEISLEEAVSMARKAIQDKYATPDAELDAMGLYPTFIPAEVEDGKQFPSKWEIYFSSRTDVNLDSMHTEYGPYGEYRVYINAETAEINYCNWYCSNFWTHAQRLWDAGKYELVYSRSKSGDFYSQTQEMQHYWHHLLSEKGYDVLPEDEKRFRLLRGAYLDLEFCPLDRIADNSNPQVAAAWQVIEDIYGYDPDLLRNFAYVATRGIWDTSTDDICIHYSYELEWSMMETGFLDNYSDIHFSRVDRCGMFMVSFAPGTTSVTALARVMIPDVERSVPITEGALLRRTVWTPSDLAEFSAAFQVLDRGVRRMRAAGMDNEAIHMAVLAHEDAVMGTDYAAMIEKDNRDFDRNRVIPDYDSVAHFFAEESEWDAKIVRPPMSYAEFTDQYGTDPRFWPMEVRIRLDPPAFRMPHPGETSMDEAIALAMAQLVKEKGQAALDSLGDYTVNCLRISLTSDPDKVDCRWEVYITDDPSTAQNGWKITWGEWEEPIQDTPTIQSITDMENG